MKPSIVRSFAAAALAAWAVGVSAHDTVSAVPRAVGVSASTAALAQDKAVSNPDTATLVRTAPSAAHDAKRAARHAEGSASSVAHHHAHRATHAASAASE